MSETYVYGGVANLFKGIEAVGGDLYLTNHALIHRPHKMNIQSGETKIDLSNITEVTTRNTFFIVPNGLHVKTTDGKSYKLVVKDRDSWMDKINSLRKTQ
ncbi:PH domain-containing protein [Halalkalibacillus halophilus]|uniref:PH domain-containing protein n=1 Tax=Halalkalibacillus halophilus TaxID=392827 RepID=UPI000406F5E1|nr:PH domain-containing protein [Halalkalibacillus halophilus]